MDNGPSVSFLFWLSIALWLVSLVSYALILSAREQLRRKDTGRSAGIFFGALFADTGHTGSVKYLYRTLVLSASGALVTGALYLSFGL